MATKTETDPETLSDEVRQLRADFTRLGDTVRGIVDHTSHEVRQSANAAADAAWTKAKDTASVVAHEIDEKPLTSALIALGVGFVLGAVLFGRRS